MNITFSQIPRLGEKIYKDLLKAEYIVVEENADDVVVNLIMNILHQDLKLEERITREAKKMLEAQRRLADESDETDAQLLQDIKNNIARNREVVITSGKERAEVQTNKIIKALWKVDELDFYVDDKTLRKSIFGSIQLFIAEEDGILAQAHAFIKKHYANLEPYSDEWYVMFDKALMELRSQQR